MCGRLADRLRSTRTRAQLEPCAHVGLGQRRVTANRPKPERHDVDPLGGDAQQRHEVLAGALRVGDHPMRAAHRARHEHAHALVAQARVRLRKARVDQVVHRDDATKASPQRRGARHAVHQLNSVARGEHRQERLLSEHPLCAAAGVDGHGDGRQQLAPGSVAGGCRLAIDEGGEAHVGGRRRQQRGDQLARSDLHATGLARHEEDQVEPDAHYCLMTSNSARMFIVGRRNAKYFS